MWPQIISILSYAIIQVTERYVMYILCLILLFLQKKNIE